LIDAVVYPWFSELEESGLDSCRRN